MLAFILAVLATLISLVVRTLSDHVPPPAAWAQAPVSAQVMDTNIHVILGADKHLFFPSDDVVFKHNVVVPATQRRITLDLGKPKQVVLYVPQKRAIREQEAQRAAKQAPVCPRTAQDVNAAVLWQQDRLAAGAAAEMPEAEARHDAGVPLRSLYRLLVTHQSVLKTDAEPSVAWNSVRHEIARHPGVPVDVTTLLGANPAKTRYLARMGTHGRLVSIWTVTPIEHAVHKFRIEVEQDAMRRGTSITTAIFTNGEATTPCLELAERISAQANRVLADASTRMRLH